MTTQTQDEQILNVLNELNMSSTSVFNLNNLSGTGVSAPTGINTTVFYDTDTDLISYINTTSGGVIGISPGSTGPTGSTGPIGPDNILVAACTGGTATVNGNGFPSGQLYTVLIPGGVVSAGQQLRLDAWADRISGGSNIDLAVSGRNIGGGMIEEFIDMAGLSGNNPLRATVNIIVYGDTSYQAFMDASNAGNSGTESKTNSSSNVDMSMDWELSFHRKDGGTNTYVANGFILQRIDCMFNEGVTQVFP